MTQNANPFGTDLGQVFATNGAIDLDPSMGETSGRTLLVQRCLRRLTTPRGSVVNAPNDCLDLRGYIRAGVLAATPQQLQALIQREMLKEQGVTSAAVGVSYVMQTATLTVTMSLGSSYGPLALTLTLSPSTITVLVNGLPLGF